MTIEEVVDIAKAGALQGCTEALFTLGEAEAGVELSLSAADHTVLGLCKLLACMAMAIFMPVPDEAAPGHASLEAG